MQVDALTSAGTHPVANSIAVHGPGAVTPSPTRQDGSPTSTSTSTSTTLPQPSGQPVMPWTETSQLRSILTTDMVQNELMNMGVTPTTENVAIAQSLAKLGLPLTQQTMAEAHASLAAAGTNALPQSFALSKVLSLPPSPGVLRGLSSVMAASSGSQASGSVLSMLQSVMPAVLAPRAALPVDAVIEPAEVTTRRNLPIDLLSRIGLTND